MLRTLVYMMLLGFFNSSLAQDITLGSQVTMLALGDSYTIGTSVSEEERWPHQFTDAIRELGISAEYPDYIATNGWTTGRLIQGMNTMLDREKNYNLVSILIGVNNQYQGRDISEYEPDLREIINLALPIVDQDSSRIFVLSIPDYAYTPFGRGRTSISQEIDAYNAIKSRVAAQYNLVFIDITPISRLGLGRPDLVANDGLHPSGKQYKEWVDQVLPRLELPKTLNAAEFNQVADDPLIVYPNPAESLVHIQSTENLNWIRLINAQGSLVKEILANSPSLEMDLSAYPPGSYVLLASPSDAAKDVFHRKIILLPRR